MSDPEVHTHSVASGRVTITVEEHRVGTHSSAATIVFLPALGVPLGYYRPFLTAWVHRGRQVLGVETRGMPQSPIGDIRRDSFGYRHLVQEDLPAVFSSEPLASAPRIVLVGHSLGGQLALLAAAADRVRVDAVVTIASGSSSTAAVRTPVGRLRRRLEIGGVRLVSGVVGYWPGHRLGFAGRQVSGVMRDWAYEARTGRYRLHGDDFDYEAALAALTTPVHLVALEGDSMIPPAAVHHLAARIGVAASQTTLPAGSSGAAGFDHFTWARRTPDAIIDDVENWLARSGL